MKKRPSLPDAKIYVNQALREEMDDRYDRRFAILHAVSDNRFKRMDIISTKKVL